MSIRVNCSCGKSYQLKDEFAGKQIRCPSCNNVIKIPAVESDSLLGNDPLGNDPLNDPLGDPLGLGGFSENATGNASHDPLQPADPLQPTARLQRAVTTPASPVAPGSIPTPNATAKRFSPKNTTSGTSSSTKFFDMNATGLDAVNQGIRIVFAANVLKFLALIPVVAIPYMGFGLYGILNGVGYGLSALVSMISIAGYYFCTRAPKDTDVPILAWIATIATAIAAMANSLTGVLGFLLAFTEPLEDSWRTLLSLLRPLGFLNGICGLAVLVSFLIFIHKVATHTGQRKIAGLALQALYSYFAIIGLGIVISVGISMMAGAMLIGGARGSDAYEAAKGVAIVGLLVGLLLMMANLAWQCFYCYVLYISKFRVRDTSNKSRVAAPGWKPRR